MTMNSDTWLLVIVGLYFAYLIWSNVRPTKIQSRYAEQQEESLYFSKEGREWMQKNYAENRAIHKENARNLDRIATALEAREK